MQEYFLNRLADSRRAASASCPARRTLPGARPRGRRAVRRLLDFFHAHGPRIVYTTVASELPDGSDLMLIFQQRNAANRAAVGNVAIPCAHRRRARIVASLEPAPGGAAVVNKVTTHGMFTSTGLDHTLRLLGITSLVVGGVVTNVRRGDDGPDAADRGDEVVLLDDGARPSPRRPTRPRCSRSRAPSARVRSTDEVLAVLKGR